MAIAGVRGGGGEGVATEGAQETVDKDDAMQVLLGARVEDSQLAQRDADEPGALLLALMWRVEEG